MSKPLVSIIIPTFNSEQYLNECLNAIKNQTYPNLEVIMVDKRSQDQTVDIINTYSITLLIHNGNVSEARNYGLSYASGDYYLFLDSDQVLTESVVEECVELVTTTEITQVIIPEQTQNTIFLHKILDFEKEIASISNKMEIPRFYRSALVFQVDGFNTSLRFGEDWDLYQKVLEISDKTGRINTKIIHYEPTSFIEILKKSYNYGKYFQSLIIANPKPIKKRYILPENVKSLFHILKKPLMGVLFILFRLLKGFSFLFGYLSSLSKQE